MEYLPLPSSLFYFLTKSLFSNYNSFLSVFVLALGYLLWLSVIGQSAYLKLALADSYY